MATRVRPVVTFPNVPTKVLEYLVERTAETVGQLVGRSQVIIVGSVRGTGVQTVSIRPEHVAALQPWLSAAADGGPQITVQVTEVEVEQRLLGPETMERITLLYPFATAGTRGDIESVPIFLGQDRGLLLLREVPAAVPYRPYLNPPVHQLAPGERGVRNFLVTDYDAQGRPVVKDQAAGVQELVTAIQWYVALPTESETAVHQALAQALEDPNPRIARHAIRALAQRGDPGTLQLFRDRLPGASEDLQVRLMLGLWLLGEAAFAEHVLAQFYQRHGEYPWLARWGIEPSRDHEGRIVPPLFAQDPSEARED